jgi:hypothetical protein
MSMSDPDNEALIEQARGLIESLRRNCRVVHGGDSRRCSYCLAADALSAALDALVVERAARVAAEEQRDRAIADLIEAGNVAARLVAAEERADQLQAEKDEVIAQETAWIEKREQELLASGEPIFDRMPSSVRKLRGHIAAPVVVPVEPPETSQPLFPNDYPEAL